MDIYCPTCREPWDNDSLHDEADARKGQAPAPNTVGAMLSTGTSYNAVAEDFRKRGCKALELAFGPQPSCKPMAGEEGAREAINVVYELLGDDMDGAACFFEDALSDGLI